MSSQWGQSLPRPPALTLGPRRQASARARRVTPAGLPDQAPSSSRLASRAVVKTLWETKLPARGGHFKITCRSSLKTSLSWQIKETRGLQRA